MCSVLRRALATECSVTLFPIINCPSLANLSPITKGLGPGRGPKPGPTLLPLTTCDDFITSTPLNQETDASTAGRFYLSTCRLGQSKFAMAPTLPEKPASHEA